MAEAAVRTAPRPYALVGLPFLVVSVGALALAAGSPALAFGAVGVIAGHSMAAAP